MKFEEYLGKHAKVERVKFQRGGMSFAKVSFLLIIIVFIFVLYLLLSNVKLSPLIYPIEARKASATPKKEESPRELPKRMHVVFLPVFILIRYSDNDTIQVGTLVRRGRELKLVTA